MENKIMAGEAWSNKKSMKNSTVQVRHATKFRVKVLTRFPKLTLLKFDKTTFLENFEPKIT